MDLTSNPGSLLTLSQLLNHSKSLRFLICKMGDSNSTYLIELSEGLNEVVYLKYLAQSL